MVFSNLVSIVGRFHKFELLVSAGYEFRIALFLDTLLTKARMLRMSYYLTYSRRFREGMDPYRS